MGKWISNFETTAAYEAAESSLATPHVSLTKDNMNVHYKPYVPVPPMPTNIITYTASSKLAETTSDKNGGLHTNAFNTTITSHTFENGVGTIEFDDDVTSIGKMAFYSATTLTSISIPRTVTIIESATNSIQGAFNSCANLTSCTFDNSSQLTNIGDYAFDNCRGLTSINIPNGVTSIGSYTFSSCSGLTSINIPNGVTSIGSSTFSSCRSLTSIEIPSGVTSIGQYAFQGCSSLTSIVCNATTAPTIQRSTFQDVKTNGTLTVPAGSTGYNVWMGTGDFYLGYYDWTKVEQ